MGRNVGGVGKCVGVWRRCREVLGEIWGSVLGCGGRCGKVLGRCGEMLGEVWESVLGCGESKGRCGEKCRGVGKCVEVWGEV